MNHIMFIAKIGLERAKIFIVLVLFCFSYAIFFGAEPVHALPGIITYQGKLTNASNVAVSDASYSIKFIIYDASSGGNVKYTAGGTTGTPTAISVSVTNGFFSVDLGGSGTNSIDPTIFQSGDLYLGVTVASDSEMTPRKQLTNTPFAYNALYLSGLATSTSGGTNNFIPVTGSTGNLTLTGTPASSAVSAGVLYLNPASATSGYTLLGLAVGGVNEFRIDEGGNVYASGTIKALTSNLADIGAEGMGYRTIYASTSIKLGSSGNPYTFFADASTSRVGINSSTPGRTLDVGGSFMFSGSGIFGDASTDTLTMFATSTFNAGISSQSIIPLASNTYDIGSGSTFFRNIYTTGTISTTNLTVTGSCTGCGGAAASGWTDGGTAVYLTTATDYIGVGTSTPNAKLAVSESTNNVVLSVQANTTQTADMMQWLNGASSSVLARIDSGGGIVTSSTLKATGVSTLYGATFVDPNNTLTSQRKLIIGASSAAYSTAQEAVMIRGGAEINGAGRGQVQILDIDNTADALIFGMDQSGGAGGIPLAQISSYDISGANALDLDINAARLRLFGDTNNPDITATSDTPSVIVANSDSGTLAPILALQHNTADRLYIYGTSTKSVVFKSLVTDQAGADAFVFDTLKTITSGTDRALFSIANAQQRRFSVSAGGNVYALNSFIANTDAATGFPGDLAEYVPIAPGESVEAGDVLMVDPQNPLNHRKTQQAFEVKVAGIISNTGAFIIGNADNGKRVPLALAGLVNTKATNESGAISIGDLLVTSNVPGHVMRYDPTTNNGLVTIVGMALENFDSPDGKVLVHVRNSFVNGGNQLSVVQNAEGNLATPVGETTMLALSGTLGTWHITQEGELVAKNIETGKLVIRASNEGDSTIGEGVFMPGEQTATIQTTAVTDNSLIFFTFFADLEGRSYFVEQRKPGESFIIRLSKPTEESLRFDWWILEKKSVEIPKSEMTTDAVLEKIEENTSSTVDGQIVPSTQDVPILGVEEKTQSTDTILTSSSTEAIVEVLPTDDSIQ